ncbi:MAG: TRAP transporter small permease [Geminicoccaceae bacterium]|nr:TRAP transporter small permease [Geminicoccaceae bacterium]
MSVSGARVVLLAERGGAFLAALALLVMGLVTVVDVTGRYAANAPLPGSYEIVQLSLAVSVFAALPLATARREHVVVDVLDAVLPRAVLRVFAAATLFLSALVLAALSWQLALRGLRLAEDRAATNLLRLPLAPLAWLMAVATASAVPAMLAWALAAARGALGTRG